MVTRTMKKKKKIMEMMIQCRFLQSFYSKILLHLNRTKSNAIEFLSSIIILYEIEHNKAWKKIFLIVNKLLSMKTTIIKKVPTCVIIYQCKKHRKTHSHGYLKDLLTVREEKIMFIKSYENKNEPIHTHCFFCISSINIFLILALN
jgi:hypothetical protein